MDDQPMREFDKMVDKSKETVRRSLAGAEAKVATGTEAIAEMAGETIDQAKTIADQAKTVARDAGEQVWSAASDAAATAQDLAQQARDRAVAASGTLYQQGAQAGEYLTRNVNQYPLTALLIAGGIGYLTAYLMHSSWSPSASPADKA